ncbi:hypothetical protein [uncultured Selenomonas sp.]|nr:hypothetical protein [uncultured Selenomonas sp.]
MTRKPYYARFVGRGGSYFEIRLLCVHTHFTDRDQRRQELDNLLKEVYPQVEDRIYYKGRPSYTIVLGDYNAELRRALNISGFYVADIETANRWGGKKIQTVQNEKTTLKRNFDNGGQDVDTSTCVGEGYANNYDHFSYDLERFSGIHIDVKRIDAVATYCGGDFETYFKTVSDHVPIIMTMSLK